MGFSVTLRPPPCAGHGAIDVLSTGTLPARWRGLGKAKGESALHRKKREIRALVGNCSGQFESHLAPLIVQCTNRRKGEKLEIWFRVIHVTEGKGDDSLDQEEQIVEVTLGPKRAFENNSATRLTRLVPANRVVNPVPRAGGRSPSGAAE